jgi:hypothetical protein
MSFAIHLQTTWQAQCLHIPSLYSIGKSFTSTLIAKVCRQGLQRLVGKDCKGLSARIAKACRQGLQRLVGKDNKGMPLFVW